MSEPILARRVLDHIEAHPEALNQSFWALRNVCGTTYCYAGHTVALAHPNARFLYNDAFEGEANSVQIGDTTVHIETEARRLLGLSDHDASRMFSPVNRLEHLRAYVEQMEAPDFAGILTFINPLKHNDEDDES